MSPRDRLSDVLRRVNLAAAELRLQPEVFNATVLLELSAGDLSAILRELFPDEESEKAA